MPELGPYGSVRGARGNSRPYRESRVSDQATAVIIVLEAEHSVWSIVVIGNIAGASGGAL